MSPRRVSPSWGVIVVGLVAVVALVGAEEALARVGGGQSFGSGRRSSGGGGGGGGGGDGLFVIVEFLIRLCIHYPAIGIPVTIGVVGYFVWKWRSGGSIGDVGDHVVYRAHHVEPAHKTRRLPERLRSVDANFSEPLFLDYVQLAYARLRERAGAGDVDALVAIAEESVRRQLQVARGSLTAVEEIIFGSIELVDVRVTPTHTIIAVHLLVNLTEVRGKNRDQRLREERVSFRRAAGVLSPGPERMQALACVGCGATADPDSTGRCTSCGTVRTGGASQWEISRVDVIKNEAISPPALHLGVEDGTDEPTRYDPDLPAKRRALVARHPDFKGPAFMQRTTTIFHELQRAWDTQQWQKARAFQTDALFSTHRFWLERYARFGLKNRLDDVQVTGVDIAKVELDAFYESITVRIHARMKDWTEEVSTGRVVSGDKERVRSFSEYWTFIRAVGAHRHGDDPNDTATCPSCGAPLDISMTGVCSYCDAKVSTGRFDWVLSRIEQDEVYRG